MKDVNYSEKEWELRGYAVKPGEKSLQINIKGEYLYSFDQVSPITVSLNFIG